ncbi:class I SAM-dependent methyltransferase [Brassicibacter mesophilus]|uniref:class I SAM-dependent methyltransferase n=1 Tax=Brassicibacter mesophilus TaxID=745119 RepID=UPI003D1E7AA0
MKVDYNEISKKYDDVRTADLKLINLFLDEVKISDGTRILDFGCGTGNYTDKLRRVTGAKIFGVEPSDGMRKKAKIKNPNINILKGNHEKIPFENDFFDFIYMTDVIHHVPNIETMFNELKRILKINGKICIATQSHKQIEKRFYVKYFPATAKVDKERYPDIERIILAGQNEGLEYLKSVAYCDDKLVKVGQEFVELVEKKGYSMFHLIGDDEYIQGLQQLKNDVKNEMLELTTAGGTLVWFKNKRCDI